MSGSPLNYSDPSGMSWADGAGPPRQSWPRRIDSVEGSYYLWSDGTYATSLTGTRERPLCKSAVEYRRGLCANISAMGGSDGGLGQQAFGGSAATSIGLATYATGGSAVACFVGARSPNGGGGGVRGLIPRWPGTAAEMDEFLGVPGTRVPDGPKTAGRGKVEWKLSNGMKITFEQHPYHQNAPPFHTGPHWHLDTPGKPHQRYVPGDPIPGY